MRPKGLLIFLAAVLVLIGLLTVRYSVKRVYYTPTLDTYKLPGAVPEDVKTHYHSELGCPLLRAEVIHPNEIRKVILWDGTLKQVNSSFQATREPCRLCVNE